MWIKATTPVKVLPVGEDVARVIGEENDAVEVSDADGAEIVKLKAGIEIPAPAAKKTAK